MKRANLVKTLGLATALAFGGLANAQVDTTKTNYVNNIEANVLSTPDMSRFRAVLETKDFTIKGFEKTTSDTTIYGGHVKVNIPKTKTSLWYRHDEGLNAFTLSTEIKKQSIFPFYLQFDDKTNEYLGTMSLLMGNIPVNNKNNIDYGACWVVPCDGKNLVGGKQQLAGYALLERPNSTTGIIKEYDQTYHLIHGFDTPDLGALLDGKVDFETGDWNATAVIAENPGLITSKKGPHEFAVFYGLGYFEEHVPYFSSTGTKSKRGSSAKISIGELADNLMLNLEAGYNTGKVGFSAGAHYKEGANLAVKPYAAIAYKGENTFSELKFSKDDNNNSTLSLYFAIDLK
ncbi:hypothetical protein JXA48_03480 [Candidatus Woesearchaeota archaeon]|nr:hypothetical protein [Candidatus Woesearchaeota archaeon]